MAQVLHQPSFVLLFSYPFVMALVDVVQSLQQLREVFDAAPKGACEGCTEWMPVQLTGLVLRCNAPSTTATHHWACVQVSSPVVDGRTYSLSAGLDAHVTIGSWEKTGDDSSWHRYFDRVRGRMATNAPMLDMVMKPNGAVCCDRLMVFSSKVDSKGGSILHGASQALNACGLTQKERPPRQMSLTGTASGARGQVFHLSVYESQPW